MPWLLFTSILWISTPLPHRAPSLRACSSFSCPILSIISGSHFSLFQILSVLSFLILSPDFPCVFLSSLLILHILAFLCHLFPYSHHQPPAKCLHSSPFFQVFLVPLCKKPQTPKSSSSQSHPLHLSGIPLVAFVAPFSESEAKLAGNPQRLRLNPTYFEWYRSTLPLNCYSLC